MKNMEMPQKPKNQDQFEINFNQPEQVDLRGRNKKEIMKQCGLANESLLSFNSESKKWEIEHMPAEKWKKKMDKLYEKTPDDFIKGR
ncbi:MAG: hypothetical protein AAB493_01185 [Patescibacteria group bacterium]|mgnify:CR=1 FL=1